MVTTLLGSGYVCVGVMFQSDRMIVTRWTLVSDVLVGVVKEEGSRYARIARRLYKTRVVEDNGVDLSLGSE